MVSMGSLQRHMSFLHTVASKRTPVEWPEGTPVEVINMFNSFVKEVSK
jgi:hypothetical protein